MGELAIRGTVITPHREIADGLVLIEEGEIRHVGRWEEEDYGQLLDCTGSYVVPGFVDIHVHGGMGHDSMDRDPESLQRISKFLAGKGVTSFLPTTHSTPQETLIAAAETLGRGIKGGVDGAVPLGIHMEGPFISPQMCGAQNNAHVRHPDKEEIQSINEASGGRLQIVTLAPEVPGAIETIQWLKAEGIVAAAGHTNATHDEMTAAVEAGLSHASHLFNGMRPFHHREPGAAGTALADSRVTVELIADGVHVHEAALRMAAKLKGPGMTALVSDSIAAAGLPDGEYEFGGQKVYVREGRSALESGRLAGSTIGICDAVRNMMRLACFTVPEAVEMASATPSRIIGASDRKGSLAPGMDADIAILDRDLYVLVTLVGGEIAYRRG